MERKKTLFINFILCHCVGVPVVNVMLAIIKYEIYPTKNLNNY